ncbi:hypothetical protein P43SY_011361 [Pythium insidiosum]|uniref:COP9 signalosome complex subunit 6 n=1 Tax=Pythium insidiosum TaxID=114742 RepID=A0AAD5M5U1_PYTIN|nr:hypothetical protein P43SY_011361 [Pythium insidiosum]
MWIKTYIKGIEKGLVDVVHARRELAPLAVPRSFVFLRVHFVLNEFTRLQMGQSIKESAKLEATKMHDTEMKQSEPQAHADANENGGGERHVQIHPLVVMNIADHYTRQKRNFQHENKEAALSAMPQVIGALFGVQNGLDVAVFDSFEIKYDIGGNKDVQIDKEFLTSRIQQLTLVWLKIMEFNESPLFLLMDPTPQGMSTKKKLPIALYESELHVLDGSPTMIFVKTSYKIETSEMEGICVDRISKIAPMGDSSKSSLHPYLGTVRDAIKMLQRQVEVIVKWLNAVKRGEIAADHNLLRQISSMCNQLPALSSPQFDASFLQEYNDAMLVSYLATLTKGATNANTVIDRFAMAQERPSRGNMMG